MLYTFVIPTAIEDTTDKFNFSLFDDISSSQTPAQNSGNEEQDSVIESETDSENEIDTDTDTEQEISHETTPKLYFTDSPVLSDDSYSDQNIYINVETVRVEEYATTVYVAEVRLKSAMYLKTAFANDIYGLNQNAYTSKIATAKNAVLAINGDNYGSRQSGYVIRNGTVYRATSNGDTDLLCIYADGHFEITNSAEKTAQQLIDEGVWQAFSIEMNFRRIALCKWRLVIWRVRFFLEANSWKRN